MLTKVSQFLSQDHFYIFCSDQGSKNLHKTYSTLLFRLLTHTFSQESLKWTEGLVRSGLRTGAWLAQGTNKARVAMLPHFSLLSPRAHGLCFKFWFYWKAQPLRAASSLLPTATSLGLTTSTLTPVAPSEIWTCRHRECSDKGTGEIQCTDSLCPPFTPCSFVSPDFQTGVIKKVRMAEN